MGTKFGVNMEDLKKLRQFQFLLMKRKIKTVDKMSFLANVQITWENVPIPEILKVYVVDTNIQIDDGSVTILKSRIFETTKPKEKQVLVRFKRSLPGLGSFVIFNFKDDRQEKEFLDAIGPIDDYGSDDGSWDLDGTPPHSDISEGSD